MRKAVLGLTENKAFLDDVPEERMQEILNDPGFQAWAENMTREAKERQLKLRQDELSAKENGTQSDAPLFDGEKERFRGVAEMNAKNAILYFLEEVPELKPAFEQYCKEESIDLSEGQYVVWGLGLRPCLVACFDDVAANENVLKKAFAFFERMADAEEEVREVLLYAVLEVLGDDDEIYQKACSFMGEHTLEWSKKVEAFWGRRL